MMNQELPPIAKIVPETITHLGRTLVDNYSWLQDKADPEVLAFLEAENSYARSGLAHTEALQEQVYREMVGRIQEDDSSYPERHGEYYYYWRIEEGKQYRIFCRRHGSPDGQGDGQNDGQGDGQDGGPEEVLVDENELARGLTYCRVLVLQPSPDHNLLAYSVDTTGAFVFDLYVKDLRTGAILTGPIANTGWSMAWASDNRTLFYTVFDASHRPFKLLRHRVGTDPTSDALVYHEADDAFPMNVQRTTSGAFILLTMVSATTTEVHFLPADQPTGAFQVVQPRQHWMEYYVAHHGGRFLIRTNDQAENFKLVEAPVDAPGKANWREVIPHRPDTLMENVSAFQNFLVVYERRGGLKKVRISAPDGVSNVRYVDFPDSVYTFRGGDNRDFNTTSLRLIYSSLVTPESTVDYDMAQAIWQVRKRQVIPSGYDASRYVSERVHAPAPDGAQVPISLVYRKGLNLDGSNPLLLYGYGSYGYSMEPGFDTTLFSLVDRGFVYAIAHIRGGSELGRAWYEQGRLLHKKNTFTDFIACAEHLIAQGYTAPERLATMGGSAGGLLVSAVANMRPDIAGAVVAMVPFTNVITAMLTPDLPLTVIEYEQWGNPSDPEAFDYMLSYSPYENVAAKPYPHIYAKAGLNDLQVPYWDPAKWVAKLRAYKTGGSRLFLVTNMGAGHGGASGRYEKLREEAQMYAFVIDAVGARQEVGNV